MTTGSADNAAAHALDMLDKGYLGFEMSPWLYTLLDKLSLVDAYEQLFGTIDASLK